MAKMKLTPRQIAIASDDDGSFDELSQTPGNGAAPGGDEKNDASDDTVDTEVEDEEEPDDSAEIDTETEPEPEGEAGWVDDDVRDMAKGYGLADDDLKDFTSREDFDRFGRVYDRKIAREHSGKSAAKERPPGETQETETKETPAAPTEPKDTEQPKSKKLDIEALKKAGWDEEFVQLAEIVNSQQEENAKLKEHLSKVQTAEDRQQQEVAAKQEEEFHQLMDKTDPDLFGKALDGDSKPGAKLTTEHLDNRRKVWETMVAISQAEVDQANAMGVAPPPVDLTKLQRRATQAAFGGRVKSGRNPNTDAVKRQSAMRRPVATSSSRGARPSATVPKRDAAHSNDVDVADIVNAPDVVDFWRKTQQENGVD